MQTNRERLLAQMPKKKEAPSFKVYGEYPGLIKSVEKHNDKTYKASVDLIDENDLVVNQTLYLTKAVDIPNIQSCYEIDEINDNNINSLVDKVKVVMFQLRPNKNYTNDLFKYQFTVKAPDVVYTDTQENTETEGPAF